MNTSLKKITNVLKQEGTSQRERYVKQLHETDELIDDRKLHDLILYVQRYSKNLLFIDLEKTNIDYEESWEEFFANNPALLIADIAAVKTNNIKEEYDHLNDIFQNHTNIERFSELAKFVLTRFVDINRWYVLSPPDSLIYEDLNIHISSYLQREIEDVKEIVVYCFEHLVADIEDDKKAVADIKNEKSRKELESFDAVWKLNTKEKIQLREKIFSGNDENAKLLCASITLDRIFDNVFYATKAIVEKAGKYFDETIHHKQDHSPHVALVITFLKLFQYQQKELNEIPKRLLKYYYNEVLGIKEKTAVADQAYIVFELAKGFDTCLVKKGTKLSAGKNKQNQALIYTTDKDIVVNKATVSQVSNVFIGKNQAGQISNYYTATIAGTTADASAGDPPKVEMFGQPTAEIIAEVGFAIASSQLYLAKGERNVIVKLDAAKNIELFDKSKNNKPVTDFDTNIVKLLLTGEKGWLDSDNENSGVKINSLKRIDDAAIELNFSISITQVQAIVGFDGTVHEGSFNTDFPVLKCVLKFPVATDAQPSSDERLRQLNILQQWQVTSANISVRVGSVKTAISSFDGVRDLVLENDEAMLESKKPFYPFTPIPKVGSTFYIGCDDLFYKKIQFLSINIEWVLPDNFKSYYQKYYPPYDSNKFIANLSYLDKNRWKKYGDISLIDVNASIPAYRVINMNFEKELPEEDAQPSFNNIKENGTLKLKLGYPDFGHGVYPQLVTATVMDKAKASNVDYYKLIKNRFREDVFTIELPKDIDKRNGSLKVIYDILENIKNDPRIEGMLINALSDIISRTNDVLEYNKKTGQPADAHDEKGSEIIVHDQNFIERVLTLLRKTKVISDKVHDDKNVEGVGDIVDNLEGNIANVADFILPSKKEMNNLITNEVNKNINQTVVNAVGLILDARDKANKIDPQEVAKILNEEFEKARKVLNDLIAKKIAISLSAMEIPPPPYSPLIKAISVNYTSSKDMSRRDDDKLFQLSFTGGIAETNIWDYDRPEGLLDNNILAATNYIFPQPLPANTDDKGGYMQGMLFLGIADIQPNQSISLLFQVAEGTKMDVQQPPAIYWYYLRYNEWIPLKAESIIADSTYALQTTGILQFAMPGDANNVNTIFKTTGKYWLCAAIASNTESFPFLVDVKAQAASVTFLIQTANPQHLALPLEAEKINKVADDLPQIKKIMQPAPSFNGRLAEDNDYYNIRVSERLRHKGRAINNWDYEHLVLNEFPSIFKIKCLNNYYEGHFAAGHVTVVPIMDVRNKNYMGNEFILPKTNYIKLKKIEEFLSEKASPFVKIHAINPKLEYIFIKAKVKFYTGIDKGFYLKKITNDLIEFLTPWAGDIDQLSFSGKVYASSIINFIDNKDYVDYVTDLIMLQYTEDDKGNKQFVVSADSLESLVETELTTSHSILVSAPRHEIELVE